MNQELAPFDWNEANCTSFHGKSNMISIYMQECLQKADTWFVLKLFFSVLRTEEQKAESYFQRQLHDSGLQSQICFKNYKSSVFFFPFHFIYFCFPWNCGTDLYLCKHVSKDLLLSLAEVTRATAIICGGSMTDSCNWLSPWYLRLACCCVPSANLHQQHLNL